MTLPPEELRILFLEDVPSDAELEEIELRNAGLRFVSLRVDTREAFVRMLDEFKPDVILADYRLPTYNGREAVEYTRRTHPEIPVIMVTGALGDEAAVELLKLGARDFVLKDRLARLAPAIERVLSDEREIRARKLAEAQLRESEEKFRTMSNSAQDAIIMMDSAGKISFWNKAAERIFGYTREEAVGQEMHVLLVLPSRHAEYQRGLEHFYASGEGPFVGRVVELTALKKGGTPFPAEISVSGVQLEGKWHSIGIARDITARVHTDLVLRRLNRTLRVLNAGDEALIKAVDEAALLDNICRIIVDIGEYRAAWVGYAERSEENNIIPMTCRGVEKSVLTDLQLTWGDTARGQGLIGRAIRSGQLQIGRDIRKNPDSEYPQKIAIANDWNAALVIPLLLGQHAFGALNVLSVDNDVFHAEEVALLNALAQDMAYGISALRARIERDHAMAESRRYLDKIRRNLEETNAAIATAVELRDHAAAGDSKRVAELSVAIGRELDLTNEQLDALRMAASVYDAGKITIPQEILNKPGAMSERTLKLIRLHPEMGYEILKGIDFPWPVATIVRQHHERLDGSGYPKGLKGNEILPEAQILAVADVVGSMISRHPSRPALSLDEALKEIIDNRGTLYNADVVDACVRLFKEKGFTFDFNRFQ